MKWRPVTPRRYWRPHERIVTAATAEQAGVALGLLPPGVRRLVEPVRIFEGNVIFAGLTQHRTVKAGWGTGTREWATETCAHCFWLNDGSYFITTPGAHPHGVGTLLHELGHALWARLVVPHRRTRVYWSRGFGEVLVRPETSGFVPGITGFTGYAPDVYSEQFAEAFRIWLSPRELLQDWEVGRFFARAGGVDCDGWRCENRRLLGWFNEVAGWETDRLPLALRP